MTRPQSILVVDDDVHNVELIGELCRHLGFDVLTAGDGETALVEVREKRPDLVLLDLHLPNLDGFAVLEKLKADPATADLPVVIVTANTDMDAKVRGIELGADDFLTKPFKLFELKTRVRAALQLRQFQDRMRVAEEALAQHTGDDPVTGASMFAQLHTHLDYEVTRARRYGRPLAALMVAVDEFMEIRERLGAEKADEALASVVRAIRRVTRNVDRVFRIDVEEFVVLLPETPVDGALIVAGRIRDQSALVDAEGELSCSIGAAAFPHAEIRGGEDLLSAANEAMKTARRAGLGNIAQYE